VLDFVDLRGAKLPDPKIGSAKLGSGTITLIFIADTTKIATKWKIDEFKKYMSEIKRPIELNLQDPSSDMGLYNWVFNNLYPYEYGRFLLDSDRYLFIMDLIASELDMVRIRDIFFEQNSAESVAIFEDEINNMKKSLQKNQIDWLESYRPKEDLILFQDIIYKWDELRKKTQNE